MSKKQIGIRFGCLILLSLLLFFTGTTIQNQKTQQVFVAIRTKETEQIQVETVCLRYPKKLKPDAIYEMTITYNIHKGNSLLCEKHRRQKKTETVAHYGCSEMKTTKTFTARKPYCEIRLTLQADPSTITKPDGTQFQQGQETLCPRIEIKEKTK